MPSTSLRKGSLENTFQTISSYHYYSADNAFTVSVHKGSGEDYTVVKLGPHEHYFYGEELADFIDVLVAASKNLDVHSVEEEEK